MGSSQVKQDENVDKGKKAEEVELFQFQIKDAVKAARIEATEAYIQYVEEPKTSQLRGRFDLELVFKLTRVR